MKRVSVLLMAGILSFLAASCIEEQEAAFKSEEEAVLTKSSDATIPSVQAAVTSDSGLAGYRGIGALLTVKCPTSNAKSIKIVSRDNSARMTGTADAPANYVEATCQTTVVGNVYYFVIYPGSYSKGFDIIFTSKNDSKIKSIVSVDGAYSIECDTITDIFNSPAGYTFGWNTSAEPSSATAALTSTYGEAKISWTANASSSYANGYKVYARENGAADNGILKQTISSLATKECTIKGLATDKTYQFGVSTAATSGNKDSQITWASELYLPKPDSCATPSHLKVVQKSGTSVTLTWQDNSGIEAAYLAFKDDGTAVTVLKDQPEPQHIHSIISFLVIHTNSELWQKEHTATTPDWYMLRLIRCSHGMNFSMRTQEQPSVWRHVISNTIRRQVLLYSSHGTAGRLQTRDSTSMPVRHRQRNLQKSTW